MTNFILTKHELSQIIDNDEIDYWYDAMSKVLPAAGINTKNRVAGFIAQAAVETGDFRTLEENLNYSESALNRVFKRYFRNRNAAEYARNPKKIANYVYMDEYRTKRGALGNVHEGDGWKFRGRGIKQLTGRTNYQRFANDHDMTVDEAIDFIETKEGALTSAIWFWNKTKCNKYADRGDIVGLSKAINGGTNGLAERKSKWAKALQVINVFDSEVVDDAPTGTATPALETGKLDVYLGIGDRGEQVKILQRRLNLTDDGVFGPNTHRAVKRFQRVNRLAADGIAGPNTLAKLYIT